jgi:predicted dehydrogenase
VTGKWKIGLVGLGGAGRSAAYMNHLQVEVTALCDTDSAVLERAGNDLGIAESARYEKYEDFLESDIDIVIIGSPLPFHASQTVAALESGKHVLSEVTAASTVEECFDIVKAVQRTGNTYMMAENAVYFHFWKQWKRIIGSGRLGTVFYAECEYVHEIRDLIVSPEGRTYWRNERPPLHYCSHSIGPILEMMDDRIVRATGVGRTKTIVPEGGVGCIDMQAALFETEKGGAIKLLRSSVASRKPAVGFYSIYGSKGFIENGRTGYGSDGWIYLEGDPEYEKGAKPLICSITDPEAPAHASRGGHGTSEYELLRDFIDALNRRAAPPIDVYRSMEYTLPGIIAQLAVEQGSVWLDVPQVR